jgi:hypothetical protein
MGRHSVVFSALLGITLTVASGPSAVAQAASAPKPATSGKAGEGCRPGTTFDRTNFDKPTRINNRLLPLTPGTRFTLEGQADPGGGATPHRVVLTVTDLTKVINGVRTVVLWDRDISDGQLLEAELAFHAQDDRGNVWNLGEYPEEFEDGEFVGAPSTWISGRERAKAGILVPGRPQVGLTFLQGFAPEVEFYDCGKVVRTSARTCANGRCYNDVLVIDEWSPLEPDSGFQRKFYAPGVGNIKIEPIDDPEGETLDLVKVERLGAGAMAAAREAALRLERRAYRISDVYATTPPAR